MALGVSKKVSDKFKKQAKLEKTIEEIGLLDVKDAVAKTNQLLQQICIYTFQQKYEGFNGDFNVLCDVVGDLNSDDDKYLMRLLNRIFVLSRLSIEGIKCDSFSQFVKEQAELEDTLINL